MAPGEIFSIGHNLLHRGTVSANHEEVSGGSEEALCWLQTIHTPLRESGISNSNVAIRRSMTGRRTVPQPVLYLK